MDNNSKLKIITIVLAIFLVSTPAVLALGVSAPYWKENPLKMYPGQVKEISFTLVNGEKEDAWAFVALSEGKEISEIISGTEYFVPPSSTDKKIILRISIPENAKAGNSYDLKFSIKSSPPKETGTVQLNIGYNVNFPVSVVDASEATVEVKSPGTETPGTEKAQLSKIIILLPLAIIVLIIFIILYISRRTKKQV